MAIQYALTSIDVNTYSVQNYLLQMAFCKLHMPVAASTDFFDHTDIILQHARVCSLTEECILEVEIILKSIICKECPDCHIQGDKYAAWMYTAMRRAQLQLKRKQYEDVLLSVTKGWNYMSVFKDSSSRRYDEIYMILDQFPIVLNEIQSLVIEKIGYRSCALPRHCVYSCRIPSSSDLETSQDCIDELSAFIGASNWSGDK